jgi:predicted DNA binding CopG/RHH family protein
MKKKIPTFKSDRAAAFVEKADLTHYDLSGAQLTRFEIKPKDKSINLRLSEELYEAVRKRAARAGVPYQRFIRLALEQAVLRSRRSAADSLLHGWRRYVRSQYEAVATTDGVTGAVMRGHRPGDSVALPTSVRGATIC